MWLPWRSVNQIRFWIFSRLGVWPTQVLDLAEAVALANNTRYGLAAKAQTLRRLSPDRRTATLGALARQFSQDSGSAQRGGDLGYFGKGSMVPAFDQAAFSLKTGTIFEDSPIPLEKWLVVVNWCWPGMIDSGNSPSRFAVRMKTNSEKM